MNIQSSGKSKPSLKNLNVDILLNQAPAAILARGRVYFIQGRVKVKSAEDESARLEVRGSNWYPYKVDIWLDEDQSHRLVYAECTCQYAEDVPSRWCKHKVAAFLELRKHYLTQMPPDWTDLINPITQRKPAKREAKRVLFFEIEDYPGHCHISAFTIPTDAFSPEVLEDRGKLADAIANRSYKEHPREVENMRSLSSLHNASSAEIAAARMLAERWKYYSYDVSPNDVLPLLTESIVLRTKPGKKASTLARVLNSPAQLEIEITRQDGIHLTGNLTSDDHKLSLRNGDVQVINRDPLWVVASSTIMPVDERSDLVDIFVKNNEIFVPEEDAGSFFANYLPTLVERVNVTGDGFGECKQIEVPAVPRVYLSEVDGELVARLRFGYENIELPFSKDLPKQSLRWSEGESQLVRVHRDTGFEDAKYRGMSSHGLKRGDTDDAFLLRQNTSLVDFMIHHIPKLSANGYEVYGEEEITSLQVNRAAPRLSLTVSSGIDWFDVRAVVSFNDLEVSLTEIRKALKKREKYVKLADGSVGVIPQDWLDKFKHLFEMTEETDDGMRLSMSQIMLLDDALSGADSANVDAELRRRIDRLKDFTQIKSKPLPEGFVGEMRQYQKVGYDWLHFLHDYEFGGCLADDMGIGKTVQALVFLLSLKENGHAKRANIIVMPRSILGNWEREAARFTPTMRVLVHADLDRGQDVAQFDNYDLILTTYGVLRRDIDILGKYRFHYALLDESQAVKNPLCHTARAVRSIRSDHRLVLTGTPVENSTSELWSQFAFLNPGMLGSLDYFKREFVSPIERRQDAEAERTLRQLVFPFVLRRTKEQVAPELPLKTERIVYCDMEPSQRKIYDLQRDKYRALLLGMIEEGGMNSARMKVLEGLLRLRQICNHPKLVDKAAKDESAKMEVLLESLETLVAERHKALVFSQFTQMLKLVRSELDKRNIPYLYLDGQTKNRQELVDRFQEDDTVPFFLISLKAGGVGLNLTAADYVIHIDPWWNPAVERQASDRTHRIGQEKPVFVNKLISRDSVEEKMLELQNRKRELVDKLITTESSFFKSLTAEDVQELFS